MLRFHKTICGVRNFEIWMKSKALPPKLYENTARGQGKAIRQISKFI
jgi:hypothetical protein